MCSSKSCKLCGKPGAESGWHLSGYFGISGYFCGKCYKENLSHDAFGLPKHPVRFKRSSLRLGSK